jgi:anaerobic magnesium-protoporphyrin IX monomethyl ester cyclase
MKILLVVKSKTIETLGPMYLQAVIKQCGHECKIVDINDAPLTAIVWHPKVIGYSIMTGDREKFMVINAEIKTQINFTSIVGGPDPTFFPQGYEWADHVVRGEGESWIANFLALRRIKIDVYSSINPSLPSPHPDRTDFPNMLIRDFITSRGCPFDCAYCYNEKWAALYPGVPRVHTRSVDDVIAEVKSVGGAFNYFQDSCFGLNRKWLLEFCDKYWVAIKTPFHCHLRPSQVDIEMASHLAMAGCYSVRFALETASDKLRKLINREHTSNEETYEASRLCRKYSIRFMVQNILGLPESTIEDDLSTLEVNIKSRPDYAWCSIFQPYPGTALADYCKQKGIYSGDFSELSDSFFDKSVLNFPSEQKEQMECLQRVFALAVETSTMPKIEELTYEQFPKLVHRLMRRQGDKRLYAGII